MHSRVHVLVVKTLKIPWRARTAAPRHLSRVASTRSDAYLHVRRHLHAQNASFTCPELGEVPAGHLYFFLSAPPARLTVTLARCAVLSGDARRARWKARRSAMSLYRVRRLASSLLAFSCATNPKLSPARKLVNVLGKSVQIKLLSWVLIHTA